MNSTISVAIATFNEAGNIKKCLDSVSDWVDEIVIYDGQSTDPTLAIAQKYKKVKIISGPNHPLFHLNKQTAIDACTSDWILQLDADEVVTSKLAEEIKPTIQNTEFNGFWIKRQNFFLGKFLTKGGVYPDPTLRLYRRGKGRLPCVDVHEQAKVDGQTGKLQNDLLHYADPTFERFLFRNNRYSSLLATQIHHPYLIDYFFFKPIITFFSLYFRHRGYVDGFPGFVFAFYSALRFPTAYVKHWELLNAKNRH
jgi:glycosyltransferase involved in cell wall biosynthesis